MNDMEIINLISSAFKQKEQEDKENAGLTHEELIKRTGLAPEQTMRFIKIGIKNLGLVHNKHNRKRLIQL